MNNANVNCWLPDFTPVQPVQQTTQQLVAQLEARLVHVRAQLAAHDALMLEEKRLVTILAAAKVK